MKKMKRITLSGFFLTLIFILINIIDSYAYDGLLFRPLTANTFEPRVGVMYQFNDKKLRLDIGNSIDLLGFNLSDNSELRIGTDFFTYTRLRSEGNFKFPVETSDYFFGLNTSFKETIGEFEYSGRLRVAHISSHLVDGLAKDTVFSQMPFVYSREFVDLVGAATYKNLRLYMGFNYIFSTIPKDPKPINIQLGFDYRTPLNSWLSFLAGYDFKLNGFGNIYSGVNSLQAGLFFRTSGNIGIGINVYQFDGNSIHGMFYNHYENYFALGFQVYFY
ncbi:MAG: DUF1207 domain-containing protein [FCB group bacterium]